MNKIKKENIKIFHNLFKRKNNRILKVININTINNLHLNNNKTLNNLFQKDINLKIQSLIFTSYAPCLEDIILLGFFYDIKNGFYIDIGANDPNQGSVTKYFYINGWNGINIEPLENKYKLLVKERNRDINLKIVAGERRGKKKIYINNCLTTTKKNFSKLNQKEKIIESDTLANICKKFVPKNKIIHFCKIDVEGGEREVLLGYDFLNFRPNVFCIESTFPMTQTPSYYLFEDILIKNNYSFIYKYDVNRYYIDNINNNSYILKQRIDLINLLIKLKKKIKF